jgi:hypothetical protein
VAVIKAVSSRASIGYAINYVTGKKKTEEHLVSGIGCNPKTAINEMKATKEIWGKTDGRQYKHIVQSFPPGEKITPEQAHKLAQELCSSQFPGYEILIATHKDKDHIHSHIIVNSVSYEDGRKFQQSRDDLQAIKDKSDALCEEYGLSTLKKNDEITAYTKGKYKALEKGINGEYKSFVVDCYWAVEGARQEATSRADFIKRMKEAGWETTWTESRKHITFANENGNKVRASNLEKTFKEPFGKEKLENEFKSNVERSNDRAATTLGRGADADFERGVESSRTGDTDAAIAKLEAAIGKSKAAVSADDRQRANRIADEQSRQRERDRAKEQRIATQRKGSRGQEH